MAIWTDPADAVANQIPTSTLWNNLLGNDGDLQWLYDQIQDILVGETIAGIHSHGLERLVADGVVTEFVLPDVYVPGSVKVWDDGVLVDPNNVTEGANLDRVTLSAAPGVASAMVFEYEVGII